MRTRLGVAPVSPVKSAKAAVGDTDVDILFEEAQRPFDAFECQDWGLMVDATEPCLVPCLLRAGRGQLRIFASCRALCLRADYCPLLN